MTSRTLRAAACAFLATTALCTPSSSHATAAPPSFVDLLDAQGVDLATALPFVNVEEAGIGSGPGRVSMNRIWAEGTGFIDNWSGGLYAVTASGSTKMLVNLSGLSTTFSGSGTLWTSDKADGATLTVNGSSQWVYTARDGTVIVFDSVARDNTSTTNSCPGADANTCRVPLSITHPNGLKFTLTWLEAAPKKRLQSVTSSAGYSLSIAYASNTGTDAGFLKRTSVTFGNSANPPSPVPTITYAYPSATVTTFTDPANRTWTFSTDNSLAHLQGVRRPGATSDNISYVYGVGGRMYNAIVDGVSTTYSWSLAGTTATNRSENILTQFTTITADTVKGRPLSYQDALNRTTSYAYDASSRLTKVTAPENNYVVYNYDARGNLTSTVRHDKTNSSTITTSASFDTACANMVTCNQPNSTTDAKGNVTNYTYDPTHGGVTTVTRPSATTGAIRPQARFSYAQVTGVSGDLVYMHTGASACQTGASCVGTSDETKATSVYNGNLLTISISQGDGTGALTATTTLTYDSHGNLSTSDGPLSGAADTFKYRYDAADQIIGATGPDPDGVGALNNRALRLTRNPVGEVTKQELGTVNSQSDADWSLFAPLQTVDTTFDANSRSIMTQLSAGGTTYALTQTSYDQLGRVNCTAVRMNTAVYGSLPDACTLSTLGGAGPDRITQNIYDGAGEATQLNVGVGTAQAAIEWSLTYTNNGQVQTLTDAENNKTTYVYDGFDRLSQTQYPSGSKGSGTSNPGDYEQLSYDLNGDLVSRRLRDGTSIGYTRDNLGRVTFKDLPSAEPDVTYGYDNLGRLTSASQSGIALSFGYDALSRQTNETGPLGTVSQQYDLVGRRTQLSTSAGYALNYQRLITGEISSILTGGNGVLASFTYDNLGNRSSLVFASGGATYYGYDPISRLSSETNDLTGTANDLTIGTVAYNAASQIISAPRSNDAYSLGGLVSFNRNYSSNGLNQYSAVALNTYGYDARGNLTSDGTATYGYSSENRLTSTSSAVALTYDPLGRLYQVTSPSGTRRFLYATDDSGVSVPVSEYDGSNALTNHYGYGPGPDQPILWWDGASGFAMRSLQADERGSIVAVVDSAGNSMGANRYDEFGIPQGGSITGKFGFTGQMWLPELAMYYYKARMYSAMLGRFMQTDPIGYADGANWYAYAHGDPVNGVDPLGLACGGPSTGGADGSDVFITGCRAPAPFSFPEAGHDGPRGGDSGPGGAGGGTPQPKPIIVVGKRPKQQCAGPTAGGSIGAGFTLFGGLVGVSLGVDVNVSVPWSSLRRGSLDGLRAGISGSVTPLAGFGLFASFGKSFGVNSIQGSTSGPTTVFQGGAGDGGGVEVSGDLGTSNRSFSGSAGYKGAIGAYGAFGQKFSGNQTLVSIGC